MRRGLLTSRSTTLSTFLMLLLVISLSLYSCRSPTWYNDRVLPPTSMTIPTSTQQPFYWKMSLRIPKSGPLWPTRTIPRCLHPLCALGLSASSGLSLSPVSTNSSSSGTLPCPSVRFVFHDRLPTFTSVLSCTPCEQIIPLLVSFPIGKALARYVPNVTLFGVELNPGPFTIKEHVIITIMASVGSGSAYAVSTTFAKQPIRVFLMPSLDRYYCRPKGLLQPESRLWM